MQQIGHVSTELAAEDIITHLVTGYVGIHFCIQISLTHKQSPYLFMLLMRQTNRLQEVNWRLLLGATGYETGHKNIVGKTERSSQVIKLTVRIEAFQIDAILYDVSLLQAKDPPACFGIVL